MRREPVAEYFRLALREILGPKPTHGVQVSIAKRTGVSPSYLNDILKERKSGSEEVRRAISAALGKSYEELINRGREIVTEKKSTEGVLSEEIDIAEDMDWLKEAGSGPPAGGRHPRKISPHLINSTILEHTIEKVESGLSKKGRALDPARKARLISLLYEYSIEAGKEVDSELVDKYLGLIA